MMSAGLSTSPMRLPHWSSIAANARTLRAALALVLLVSGGLKLRAAQTPPVDAPSLLQSTALVVILVEAELLLAVLLLCGVWNRPLWIGSTGAFAGFACFSLMAAITGHESCRCFGHIRVNPWITTSFDTLAAIFLAVARPSASTDELARRRAATALGAFALLQPLALAPALNWTQSTAKDSSWVLTPEGWIGAEFPLLPAMDVGAELRSGPWLVVLHRHDCASCVQLLRNPAALRARWGNLVDSGRVAFVELPPYGPGADLAHHAPWARFGRLHHNGPVIARTPIAVELNDGRVVQWHGKDLTP